MKTNVSVIVRFAPEFIPNLRQWYLRDTKSNTFVDDDGGYGMPLIWESEEDAKWAAYSFNYNEEHGFYPDDEDWDEI